MRATREGPEPRKPRPSLFLPLNDCPEACQDKSFTLETLRQRANRRLKSIPALGAYKAGSADLASGAGLPMLAPGRLRSVSWDAHGWPRGTLATMTTSRSSLGGLAYPTSCPFGRGEPRSARRGRADRGTRRRRSAPVCPSKCPRHRVPDVG